MGGQSYVLLYEEEVYRGRGILPVEMGSLTRAVTSRLTQGIVISHYLVDSNLI